MSNADDGGRPDDDAPPDLTVVDLGENIDAPEEFNPFDELHEDFKPIPRKAFLPDGMPSVLGNEGSETDIPALSPETLICMGVFDEFVLRDERRNIVVRFPASAVERMPTGKWFICWGVAVEYYVKSLSEEARAEVVKRRTVSKPGAEFYAFSPELCSAMGWSGVYPAEHALQEVEPIRPPCKHYVRMMSQFDLNPMNDVVYRLCAARRTTEGTFMTVRDRKVPSCDMREPRDIESEEKHLDAFDAMKVQEGRERAMVPMFKNAQAKP